jgi:hypothetical protein
VNVTGFSLTADLDLLINTTTAAVTVGTTNSVVIAPKTIRIVATTDLELFGQTLHGTFGFEQTIVPLAPGAPAGAQPQRIVRIAASNVSMTLGSTSAGVSLLGGSGFFVLTPAGLVGRIGGTIEVNIPGATLSGAFSVAINNTNAAYNDQFQLGAQTVSLSLPAGPYLRVEAQGATLEIAGQRVSGDFAITRTSATTNVTVANLSASFGDGSTAFLTLSGGRGTLTLDPSGLLGELEGTVAVNVPGVALSGTLKLAVKTGTGGYLRIGGTALSLTVAGQTLTGEFQFAQITKPDGSKVVSVNVPNASLALAGVGNVSLSGALLVTNAGLAGKLTLTTQLRSSAPPTPPARPAPSSPPAACPSRSPAAAC